jgi:hypothetical protein
MKLFRRHYITHTVKYPLFFLGLLLLIVGEVAIQATSPSLFAEGITAVIGFALLFLGIVLE